MVEQLVTTGCGSERVGNAIAKAAYLAGIDGSRSGDVLLLCIAYDDVIKECGGVVGSSMCIFLITGRLFTLFSSPLLSSLTSVTRQSDASAW